MLYSGNDNHQHHEGVTIIRMKGLEKSNGVEAIQQEAGKDQNVEETHQHYYHPVLCTNE